MAVFSEKNLPSIFGLAFYVVFFVIFIPAILLYGFNGAEDPQNIFKFMFYAGIAGILMFVIALDQLTEKRKFFKWFDTYLHNPEKGFFGNLEVVRNPIKLLMVSFIIFGALGIFSIVTNTFFIDHPSYQISEIAAIGLSAEPAAGAETLLFFAVVQGLFYGVAKLIAKKNKALLAVLLIFSVILAGTVAFPLYHKYRYGSSEESMLGIMFYGTASAMLTMGTGSIIPTWSWHVMSNGLGEFKNIFSSEVAIVIWSVIWFILSGILLFILINWNKKKKRKKGRRK